MGDAYYSISSLSFHVIRFSNHGGTYEKVYYDERKKASNECVKRSSPWQCRVLLNKVSCYLLNTKFLVWSISL